MESVLLTLLNRENSPIEKEIKELKNWNLFPIFEYYVKALKKECLYQSHIHGIGHIERVLLFGGLIAMQNHCNEADTRLVLLACSYHDIGRVDDSLDDGHGKRSSEKLPEVISLPTEDMAIVQAAIHAHSINDVLMEDTIHKYGIYDKERALAIARMLKDADALDRVRVMDLDPNFLRFSCSHKYVDFAYTLYNFYQNFTNN